CSPTPRRSISPVTRPLPYPAGLLPPGCPSVLRSSAALVTTWACCAPAPPTSRPAPGTLADPPSIDRGNRDVDDLERRAFRPSRTSGSRPAHGVACGSEGLHPRYPRLPDSRHPVP